MVRSAAYCLATFLVAACGSRTGLRTPDAAHDAAILRDGPIGLDAHDRADATDATEATDAMNREDRVDSLDVPLRHDAIDVIPGQHAPAVQVAMGARHICVLLDDDSVWCWGINEHGQLGDGTTTDHLVPRPVPGLPPAAQIALGTRHSCARLRDGHVACWGTADWGQAGDGDPRDRLVPVIVPGIDHVIDLVSGWDTLCALRDDRSVWCWGNDAHREVGLEGNTERCNALTGSGPCVRHPHRVEGFSDEVVALSAGPARECALTRSGSVWCWGAFIDSLATDGTFAVCHGLDTVPCASTPHRIDLPPLRTAVVTGASTCGLDEGGGLVCDAPTPDAAGMRFELLIAIGDGSMVAGDGPTMTYLSRGSPPQPFPLMNGVQGSAMYSAICIVDVRSDVWCSPNVGGTMTRIDF